MKSNQLTGKLQLNKEVISKLQENQMLDIKGGKAMAKAAGCSRGPSCTCTKLSCSTK